jgi:hypothetical protein
MTTFAPAHIALTDELMTAVGRAFITRVFVALVALQPLAFITTTVYDPPTVAVYVLAVAPVIFVPFNFHW